MLVNFPYDFIFYPQQVTSYANFIVGDDVDGIEYELRGSFDRLSVDGKTAIFRINEPDWSEVSRAPGNWGPSYKIEGIIEQKHSFDQMRARFIEGVQNGGLAIWILYYYTTREFNSESEPFECDLVTMEVLFPLKDLYSRYFEAEKRGREQAKAWAAAERAEHSHSRAVILARRRRRAAELFRKKVAAERADMEGMIELEGFLKDLSL